MTIEHVLLVKIERQARLLSVDITGNQKYWQATHPRAGLYPLLGRSCQRDAPLPCLVVKPGSACSICRD